MAPADSLARLRKALLDRAERREAPVTQLCREAGISRSRFYELRARYRQYGEAGLRPKPRPTERPSRQLSEPLVDAIVAYATTPNPRPADDRPRPRHRALRRLAGQPRRGRQRPPSGRPRAAPGAAGAAGRGGERGRPGGWPLDRAGPPSGPCDRAGEDRPHRLGHTRRRALSSTPSTSATSRASARSGSCRRSTAPVRSAEVAGASSEHSNIPTSALGVPFSLGDPHRGPTTSGTSSNTPIGGCA